MNGHRQAAISDTVNHLAARWAKADKRILRTVFPFLAEGKPVPVARIAAAAGREVAAAESALESGRAGRDAQGRVVELSGLQLSPTLHRIEIEGRALFACCALLAHVVPLLLGQDVTVESVDPACRRLVRMNITAQGVISARPPEAMATLATTEPDAVMKDAGRSFCCHVRHFACAETAREFVAADPCRYAVRLPELHEAARILYEAAWALG